MVNPLIRAFKFSFPFQLRVLQPICQQSWTVRPAMLWSVGELWPQLYSQPTMSRQPPLMDTTPPAAAWDPPVTLMTSFVGRSTLLLWRRSTLVALVLPVLLHSSLQVTESSVPNMELYLSTADDLPLPPEPCIPMNISTHYNASAAWVTWSAAAGASSYTVQAVTDSVAPVTCGGSNSSCHLGGLQCSRMYNVTVTAHNQACSSLPSETTHLLTGLLLRQERMCTHKPLLMFTCVFFRTMPTYKCSSQFGMWKTHCHRVLAAESPFCGIRCLCRQQKWTQHLLF